MKAKLFIATLIAAPVVAMAENTEATGEAITIWQWLVDVLPF